MSEPRLRVPADGADRTAADASRPGAPGQARVQHLQVRCVPTASPEGQSVHGFSWKRRHPRCSFSFPSPSFFSLTTSLSSSTTQCEPEDRVWPARCTRCIKQKQQCTPPHDALGRNIPYVRGGGSGGDDIGQGATNSTSGSLEPWPGRSVLLANHVPLPAAYGSELSGSSLEGTPASTRLPILPVREEPSETEGPPRTRTGRTPTADMVTHTGETIRRMEDEFHDVLRQLEKRHTRELETQRDRYEEELGVQRDRYEQRLDDLIRIMRNVGREH